MEVVKNLLFGQVIPAETNFKHKVKKVNFHDSGIRSHNT
jgi:hypothetical protein